MTEIILAIISVMATPVAAWLASVLTKAKSAQEVAKLKAEVDQMKSDIRSRELDNDRKAINMMVELVVEPLRKEMKSFQRKVDRLTNAIDKIPSCPHSASCPVSHELRRTAEPDPAEPEQPGDKGPGRRGRKPRAECHVPADGNPPTDARCVEEDFGLGDPEGGAGNGGV